MLSQARNDEELHFNERNVYELMEEVVKRAIRDYRYARRRTESIIGYKRMDGCNQRYGCSIVKEIEDFFRGSLFALAYPNIDAEWFIEKLQEKTYEH